MDFGNKEVNGLIALGIIVGIIICLALLHTYLKPKNYPQGNSLQEADEQGPFLPDTVKQQHSYTIWHDHRRQEFVVLTILEAGWMCIGVYPPDDKRVGRQRKFAFKGWAQAVCHRSFIEPQHLADSPMGSASQDHYLRRLAEINFN